MESPKVKIREAVKDILEGRTVAGGNVFSARSIPTEGDSLPSINVFINSEVLDKYTDRPKRYKRTLNLSIELTVQGTTSDEGSVDKTTHDELDEFIEQVEALLELDETLGLDDPCVSTLDLTNIDYEFESGGDAPTASAALSYELVFYQHAKRPGVQCLDDFKQVGVDYKIGHHNEPSDDIKDASDVFELEND